MLSASILVIQTQLIQIKYLLYPLLRTNNLSGYLASCIKNELSGPTLYWNKTFPTT